MSSNEKIKAARQQLGGFFKERRRQMGHDEQTVASHLGITTNTLRGIESGRFSWDIDLHFRICQALGIKPYFSTQHDGDWMEQNAIEILKKIMQERNWHDDKLERRKASMYKTLIERNKLSYKKASEILERLGWQKVREELWQKRAL